MGPLHGLRVVEIASIGPGPFCAMVLADLGAEVLRVDRPGGGATPWQPEHDPLLRGRGAVTVDLKDPSGPDVVLRLVESADALVEGFRPGVAERLGIGPDDCLDRNPNLVYGRVTGWGQEGPLAPAAGHDIDYIALSGVLGAIGRAGGPPTPPLNLVGDFGGGGLLLAFGILAALWERHDSGRGQVVDAAMVDGAALLTTMHHGMGAAGLWSGERGVNLLDSGAPFYDVYRTADGEWVAIGPLEPKFYAELLHRTGLDDEETADQYDPGHWPELRARLEAVFATKTREEWRELLEGSDACFAPVLSLAEAPGHPHNRARNTFVEVGGIVQPAPAPRFDRTPAEIPAPPPAGDPAEALARWGIEADEIETLLRSGALS